MQKRGTLERAFSLKPSDLQLCLGDQKVKHAAHFSGLLNEVNFMTAR